MASITSPAVPAPPAPSPSPSPSASPPPPSSSSRAAPLPSPSSSARPSSSAILSSSVSLARTTSSALPTPTVAPRPIVTTNPGGGVVTVTSLIATTPTSNPVSTAQPASTPFFQNKAALAGVFSVVGLVGLAISIALITNAIRRRRALKYDRDVAEAARTPVVLDDDYEDAFGRHASNRSAALTGYSDGSSNGAYGQPPMAPKDSYGMSEMNAVGMHPHGYDSYAPALAGAGAAGIGTMSRGQSMRTRPESYDQLGQQRQANAVPYSAYAQSPPQEMYDASGTAYGVSRGPSTRVDVARTRSRQSIGPHDVYYTGRASPYAQAAHHYQQQDSGYGHQQMHHQQQGSYDYGSQYQQRQQQPQSHGQQRRYSTQALVDVPAGDESNAGAGGNADPYSGYVDTPSQQAHAQSLPRQSSRRYDAPSPPLHQQGFAISSPEEMAEGSPGFIGDPDHSRNSFRDEEDYELNRANRILKVANQ